MQIEALRELVERGSRENPHLTGRLEKAAFIVVLRRIEDLGEGTYRVASEDALKTYIVQNGQCECPDYLRHGNGHFCKHRLAVGMLARLNGNGGKPNGQNREETPPRTADAAPNTKVCPEHGKARERKDGSLYCPTRVGKGWCKWRG
jgi:predicted nucleic acid-binding Zn finger protein